MERLKRLGIFSNSLHTNTGYALQIRELVKHLQADGIEVAVFANSGVGDNALHWNGIPVYPTRGNPFRMDLVATYADHFNADVILTLYDLFALPDNTKQSLRRPMIAWTPVDGVPVPRKVLNIAKQADWCLSMSRFGQEQLDAAGVENTFVPLGVDCDVFSPGDRAEARRELGLPKGAFLVGVVAANKGWPCRKAWPELIEGFANFHRMHPRDTLLYCHTTKTPYGTQSGPNLDALTARCGLARNVTYISSEADIAIGVPEDVMVQLYRAFDVLLSPSQSEGFCVPIVEAQACGTPVISQACTAMTENTYLGEAIEPLQKTYIPPLDYWWFLPSVQRITEALDRAYKRHIDERQRRQIVHRIQQTYHWPRVYERYWRPVLQTISDQLW